MKQKQNIKFLLKDLLSEKELELVPSSFDTVGDIIIFSDFPKALSKKEKLIAKTILENHRNIKVVAKKTKMYSGIFRLPKLKIIGGEKRKETDHKENGITLKLDVEKVYFSTRLGTERARINSQVKSGEDVLVMFSGCGPYVINIAKNTPCRSITGVEMNPIAHTYALLNAAKNKVEKKVSLHCGDAKKIVPELDLKFDRILMPLPKSAEEFLSIAIPKIKKGGIIHFYDFLHEGEFSIGEEKVRKACALAKKKCEILGVVKCGQYSPGNFRVCVEFKVL